MATEATSAQSSDPGKPEPAIRPQFMSHGTLACKDVEVTRRFYEEFLGLEVIRTSKISLLVRLGGRHTYAVVKTDKPQEMPFLNHNGLDVSTEAEVDRCHRLVTEQAEKWGLHRISKPYVQHGTYSFYFWDADENCWEILCNPRDGYTWLFEKGNQEGMGHLDTAFDRPKLTDA